MGPTSKLPISICSSSSSPQSNGQSTAVSSSSSFYIRALSLSLCTCSCSSRTRLCIFHSIALCLSLPRADMAFSTSLCSPSFSLRFHSSIGTCSKLNPASRSDGISFPLRLRSPSGHRFCAYPPLHRVLAVDTRGLRGNFIFQLCQISIWTYFVFGLLC